MLALTFVASNAVPSWNFIPSRSFTVHTVASAFGVTDSARYGFHEPSGVAAVKPPYTRLCTARASMVMLPLPG